jgi:hypothetical protein
VQDRHLDRRGRTPQDGASTSGTAFTASRAKSLARGQVRNSVRKPRSVIGSPIAPSSK